MLLIFTVLIRQKLSLREFDKPNKHLIPILKLFLD